MAGQRFFSFCWFSIRCQMPMSHDNQCENTSIISCQCVISLGFNFRHSFLVQVSWWAAQLTSHMPAPTSKTFIHIQRVYFSFLSESPTRRAEWARGAGLRTAPANSAPSTTSALWGGERERESEGRAAKCKRSAGRHVGSGHFKHGGDGGDGVRSRGAEPESEPKLGPPPPPPTPRSLPRWARRRGQAREHRAVSVWRRRRARRKLAAEASNRAIRSCTAPATGGGDDSH